MLRLWDRVVAGLAMNRSGWGSSLRLLLEIAGVLAIWAFLWVAVLLAVVLPLAAASGRP